MRAMRNASTVLLEQGTQTPSPAPDLIPAERLIENLHWDWYRKRGHFTRSPPFAKGQMFRINPRLVAEDIEPFRKSALSPCRKSRVDCCKTDEMRTPVLRRDTLLSQVVRRPGYTFRCDAYLSQPDYLPTVI
jgi:hypothetical protein